MVQWLAGGRDEPATTEGLVTVVRGASGDGVLPSLLAYLKQGRQRPGRRQKGGPAR